MNAKQARAATTEALLKRQQTAEEETRLKREKQEKDDEWSRTAGLEYFMKNVATKAISEAAAKSEEHVVVKTRDRIVADLAMKKLVEDEYEVHMKDVYVPEDRDYGSSGEGMHGSYTEYVIHVNWGKGRCPACEEDFRRGRSRW